ncbi:MAG: hypothetical protein WBB65_00295 [Anaerolineales bacterium]
MRYYPFGTISGHSVYYTLRLVETCCNRTKFLPVPDGIARVLLQVFTDDQFVGPVDLINPAALATFTELLWKSESPWGLVPGTILADLCKFNLRMGICGPARNLKQQLLLSWPLKPSAYSPVERLIQAP